jgi:hypothetical protein
VFFPATFSFVLKLPNPGFEDSVFSHQPPEPNFFYKIPNGVIDDDAKVENNIRAHGSNH